MKGILEVVIAKEKHNAEYLDKLEKTLSQELLSQKKQLEQSQAKKLEQLQTELSQKFDDTQEQLETSLEKKHQMFLKKIEKKKLTSKQVAQIAKKSVECIVQNGN